MPEAVAQENSIQEELRTLFLKAKLPTSPALACRILELANDPDASVDRFADLIRLDPVLSARLLRMANSAYSAQRIEVTTIQRAVILLGLNRVRTLSLSFQLVGHIDKLGKCPFDMSAYWKHSVLRGCLAREFAEVVAPSLSEEAFLVGILQDCGILVLVQILGMEYAERVRAGHVSPAAFHESEKREFRFNHVQTVAALAREWQLPATIIQPLELHHTRTELADDSTDLERLSAVSYLVGSIGLADDVVTDSVLAEYARTGLGLKEETLRNCIERAGQEYGEVGRFLQERLPDDLDVTDLLSRANACLTSAAGEAECRALAVKVERDAIEQQQVHLKNALGEYRERAALDPLTGILNRGALIDATREILRRARTQGETITVIFLDIDNFKSVNDYFGHLSGDEVLKGVSRMLGSAITNAGITGRYGGEEFVMVVCGLPMAAAERLSKKIVGTIRRTRFPGLGMREPVTCSLGAVWGIPQQDDCTECLLSAADELMYQAKRSGKNRAVFRSLFSQGQSADASATAAVEALATAVERRHRAESPVVPADYERIAKKLGKRATGRFICQRKQTRKRLATPCKVTTFTGMNFGLSHEDAYVRNISTGGIGLLTPSEKRRGEPIEVAIHVTGKPLLYVAGIVAYCQHVEGRIHEVGVQLFTHAQEPVLSSDPICAIRNLDWVASALQSLDPEHPPRRA